MGRAHPTFLAAASPRTADEVIAQLPRGYPLLIDAGPCPVGIDSTVVDLTQSPARILRPGAISREAIEETLNRRLAG